MRVIKSLLKIIGILVLVAGLGTSCGSAPSHSARNMCHGIVDELIMEGMP